MPASTPRSSARVPGTSATSLNGAGALQETVDGEEAIVAEARAVLTEGARRVGQDVRNSLDFHTAREGSTPLERMVLTGPAVAIPGFADEVAAQVGLPFDVGLVDEAAPGGFGGVDPGRLAVAAGLTVTEVAA